MRQWLAILENGIIDFVTVHRISERHIINIRSFNEILDFGRETELFYSLLIYFYARNEFAYISGKAPAAKQIDSGTGSDDFTDHIFS